MSGSLEPENISLQGPGWRVHLSSVESGGQTMLQGMADGVATEEILCPGGMPAFLALPRGAEGRLPVVVLMHERYGLVQHTRDLAVRCARDGFLTIAPDFFF